MTERDRVNDKIRVQPWMDKETVRRLDVLAKKLNWTRNEVVEWIVVMGTSDVDWLANLTAATIRGAFESRGRRGGKLTTG